MDAGVKDLQTLLDRENIRDVIARLARGEDRRSAELITASFWPDADTDYGVFKGSFADYLAWVYPGSDAITNTQHMIGQSVIALAGSKANVETQVISYHRVNMGTNEQDTVIGGRYLDRFEKRNGEWRIASRTMIYDWYQNWGESIDWSKGLFGSQLSEPHFAGRANGDFSEEFFGK